MGVYAEVNEGNPVKQEFITDEEFTTEFHGVIHGEHGVVVREYIARAQYGTDIKNIKFY